MAYPFATWFIAGGTIWSGLGLLSLQGILSASAFGPCAPDGISRRGGVVGLFMQEPLTSYPHVVCRSRFYELNFGVSATEEFRSMLSQRPTT